MIDRFPAESYIDHESMKWRHLAPYQIHYVLHYGELCQHPGCEFPRGWIPSRQAWLSKYCSRHHNRWYVGKNMNAEGTRYMTFPYGTEPTEEALLQAGAAKKIARFLLPRTAAKRKDMPNYIDPEQVRLRKLEGK